MQRTLILIYGLIVYLMFGGVFLYLIDFPSGNFVPKGVDDGVAGPIWLAVTVNLALIALFGVQHAIMARPAFKRAVTRVIPKPAERATFVLAANVCFILLFWLWRPIDTKLWDIAWAPARAALWAVHFSGWGIALISTFLIDHFDLFGLRQAWLAFKKRDYTHRAFVARAFYRFVRHPLMTGFLIAFWATPTMSVGRLVFAAGFTAYILIGIRMEERDLIARHGERYLAYKRSTPGLLPRLRRPRTDAPVGPVEAA